MHLMNYYYLSLAQYIDTIYVNTLKFSRKKMEESKDFSPSEMEAVYKVDEEILESFRKDCIESFFKVYPTYIHKSLPFRTWEEGMLWKRRVENGLEVVENPTKNK